MATANHGINCRERWVLILTLEYRCQLPLTRTPLDGSNRSQGTARLFLQKNYRHQLFHPRPVVRYVVSARSVATKQSREVRGGRNEIVLILPQRHVLNAATWRTLMTLTRRLLLVMALIALSSAARADDAPVQRDLLQKLVVGHTVLMGSDQTLYESDGRYTYNGGSPGTYRIQDRRICVDFDNGRARYESIVFDSGNIT